MTSRADRDAAHRREVEAEKRRLREDMRRADGPIFLDEWAREHRANGDYAAYDALSEMRGEIQEHNRSLTKPMQGSFVQRQLARHRRELAETERERIQKRDEERARRMLTDYRRNHPAPNLAARPGVAGGGSVDDSDDVMARVRSQWLGAPADLSAGDMKPLPPMNPNADPGPPRRS